MNALADYRLLWNAAAGRWGRSSLVPLVKVLSVLLLLLGLGLGMMRHDWLFAARIGLGIPLLLLVLVWTMIVTPALALMNTPVNARLVPRMRRRMIEMTAAAWVLAAVFGLLTPFWAATPLITLWVMSMSGARAGNPMATVLVVLAAMSGSVLRRLPPALEAFCTSPAGVLIFCMLVAAYGAWSIGTVLPNGGDRHFARRKRQVELIERFEPLNRKQAKPDRKPNSGPYALVLRRAIGVRQPSSLMLLGFGPAAHWSAMLPYCAVVMVAGLGMHLLFGSASDAQSSVAGWVLMLTLVVVVQVGYSSQWKSLVASARNEAALLRLAPLFPDARGWNRAFAGALVRNGLAFFMLTIVMTVLLALFDGASRDEMISLAALAATLVMPGIAWMLRDYSREDQQQALSWFGMLVRVVPAALVLLVGLVAMLGLQIAIGSMAWVLLAAATNVIGSLAAVWRWRQMIAAPTAFAA